MATSRMRKEKSLVHGSETTRPMDYGMMRKPGMAKFSEKRMS